MSLKVLMIYPNFRGMNMLPQELPDRYFNAQDENFEAAALEKTLPVPMNQ